MTCRPNEHFEDVINICLPANMVNCGSRRIVNMPSTTVRPPPNNWEIAPPNNWGQNPPIANCPRQGTSWIPSPTSCEEYIVCSDGIEILRRCSQGLHFNPRLEQCDRPENAQCEIRAPPTHPLPNFPPVPTCRPGNTFFPSLTECNRYFMCVNNTPILMTCPRGFLWNDRIRMCDEASNVQCGIRR
jgi:hypothetical protein